MGLLILAGSSLGWAIWIMPISVHANRLGGYANRIAAGEKFQKESLEALRPELDVLYASNQSNPSADRSAALIELRLAELSMLNGDSVRGNAQYVRAEQSARRALEVSPTDAFLWYELFWLDKTENGFRDVGLRYLEMSYQTGPNEGWVAVHRNRDAVAILSQLPPQLAQTVVSEFGRLVAASYLDDSADILTGPGWPQHDALLASLRDLPILQKRAFARRLSDRNVELAVPGLPRTIKHPWDFAPG